MAERGNLVRFVRLACLGLFVVGVTSVAIVLRLPDAEAAPQTPVFPKAIDRYAVYDPQDTCSASTKPGIAGLRGLLDDEYGHHTSYVGRDCGAGGTSEHKEGRALDYMLNANNSAHRAIADDIRSWLLATDRHGNRHANARRLGIMYMIWNRQIWRAYRASEGWQPYTGANPHTDHIHFSMSWAGARKQTTWWTAGSDAPADMTGDRRPDVVMRHGNGDLLVYRHSGKVDGESTLRGNVKIGHGWNDFAETVIADFTGDGFADVVGRHSNGDLLLYRHSGTVDGERTLKGNIRIGHGWSGYLGIAAGDLDGDGWPDVVGRHSDGNLYLYRHSGELNGDSPLRSGVEIGHGWGAIVEIAMADMNRDGRSDVIARHSNGDLLLYTSTGSGVRSAGRIGHGWTGYAEITAADLDGNGWPDVVGRHSNGELMLYRHSGSVNGSGTLRGAVKIGHGWQGAVDINV